MSSQSLNQQEIVSHSKEVFAFALASDDIRCTEMRNLLTTTPPPRSDDPTLRDRFEVAFRNAEQAMLEINQ